MKIVVSYWSGELPDITYLHFLSFRSLNPEVEYVLFLESDHGFEGFVGSNLRDQLDELMINVSAVSLNSLITNSEIPNFSRWRDVGSYRLVRKVIRKALPYLRCFVPQVSKYKIVKTELMDWVVGHNFPFSGYVQDRAFRSDLFRSLIFQSWPEHDFLYLDLDICLIRPIDFNAYPNGAIAQWGTSSSGNSAYLLLPQSATIARQGLIEKLKLGYSALPWVLYSESEIEKYQLHIFKSLEIDPAWSPESVIHADTSLFFKAGLHARQFIAEADKNCIAIHWHNQWQSVPEVDSPYDILRQRFETIS